MESSLENWFLNLQFVGMAHFVYFYFICFTKKYVFLGSHFYVTDVLQKSILLNPDCFKTFIAKIDKVNAKLQIAESEYAVYIYCMVIWLI